MPDEDAFLAAIAAHPADDTPRLAYADWLEEHDDPRAEYVRLEAERHRLKPRDKRWPDLTARLERLRPIADPHWLPRIDRVGRFSVYWPRDWCTSADATQYNGRAVTQARLGHPPGPVRSEAALGDYIYALTYRRPTLSLVARMRFVRVADYYLEVAECSPVRSHRPIPVDVLLRFRWLSGSIEKAIDLDERGALRVRDQLVRPRRLTAATAAGFDALLRDG